jgi:diguanylate cyclase
LTEVPLARAGHAVVHATASFGVAPVDPDSTVEASMDCADRMMYAAKDSGRNCVRVWRPVGDEGVDSSGLDRAD